MTPKSIKNKPKIIVILGPTATGKSDLAVQIATSFAFSSAHGYGGTKKASAGRRKINFEIISADSRQVYTGLDIGTGKITKREMQGVPHHLLDIVNPKKVFSVSDWQKLASEKIGKIIARGHTPIIVGGTGFYIQSIVDGIILPEVPPNPTLRKKLEKKSVTELFALLKKLDPKRAKTIDGKNPVRLIRAIEIATTLGTVPKITKQKSTYDFIQIGLTADPEILKQRIHTRLLKRLKQGMITEAQNLHAKGLSYTRMRSLGLEYRALADFLEHLPSHKATARQRKINKQELIEQLDREIYQYAKRQTQWFKRDKKIKWFDVNEKGWEKKIISYIN
jgi:tRNA dimethylallyltransferase